MLTPVAVIDRALERAPASVTDAARELLFDLFEGNRLGKDQRGVLSAIAERVVSMAYGMATPSSGAAPEALGDNWFQCPHCDEVFEGELTACKACGKALAMPRRALAIDLGGATLWLSPASGGGRPSLAVVQRIEWLRVEAGARWYELLDDAGRATAERDLPSAIALMPNVVAVGRCDGNRTLLIHATKLAIQVVENDALRADGTGNATELAIRELGNVLYPDAPPEVPSGRAIASKGHARNEALEAAIEADLEHADAFLVYADWLQAQGDPRGELIALQHAGKQVVADRLLANHAHHFYGRVASAVHQLERDYGGARGRETKWRWGFLDALWISNKQDDDHESIAVHEALGALLDHPSCRFLRDLSVGIVDYEDNGYDDIAQVIGERSLPTLRSLTLGDFYSEETELNWSHSGDLSPLCRGVPNLKELVVRDGSMGFTVIELPKLETLKIISGGLPKATLDTILATAWPNLITLSLQLGRDGGIQLEQLAPLMAGRNLPKLAHLGLGNSQRTDEIATLLADSAIAARLVSLDFAEGTLGDQGATALARGRFPRLERIDVRNNYLTEAGIATLRTLAKELVGDDDQRDDGGDPDDRYIGAYE